MFGRFLVLWMTLFVGLLRFVITPRLDLPTTIGSYEAMAHLWVGALIGAAVAFHLCGPIVRGRSMCSTYSAELQFIRHAKSCWWMVACLTVLECVMFAIQKIKGG